MPNCLLISIGLLSDSSTNLHRYSMQHTKSTAREGGGVAKGAAQRPELVRDPHQPIILPSVIVTVLVTKSTF